VLTLVPASGCRKTMRSGYAQMEERYEPGGKPNQVADQCGRLGTRGPSVLDCLQHAHASRPHSQE
jgi:hypothetical protein